ncbi:MAG: hypothetical protein H0U34_04870 [Sphingomonas sp.]|nr:hypothetical protein [Sphingomonas sp.]
MLAATLTLSVLSVLLTQSSAPTRPVEPPLKADTIVVTGSKDRTKGKVEEPYSTTPRVVTGSRIARIPSGRRVFTTVATDTGLAGLIADKDNNFDAAGGAALNFRKKRVKECKADRHEVSEATACVLFDVTKAIEAGEYPVAASKLDELKSRALNGFERYYVAFYSYQLAEAQQDDGAREVALKAMLASGRMHEGEQLAAKKTLVALALKRGDSPAAIAALEELLAVQPGDARSHANLAALYERSGMRQKARTQMAAAVMAMQQSGRTPPSEWVTYLRSSNR